MIAQLAKVATPAEALTAAVQPDRVPDGGGEGDRGGGAGDRVAAAVLDGDHRLGGEGHAVDRTGRRGGERQLDAVPATREKVVVAEVRPEDVAVSV